MRVKREKKKTKSSHRHTLTYTDGEMGVKKAES
jgi:hypothetical protein